MSNLQKIKVKPAKNKVVYSDFKDGFMLDSSRFTELAKTHWIEKRIKQGDLLLKTLKSKGT